MGGYKAQDGWKGEDGEFIIVRVLKLEETEQIIESKSVYKRTSIFRIGSSLDIRDINKMYDQLSERLNNGEIAKVDGVTDTQKETLFRELEKRGVKNLSDKVSFGNGDSGRITIETGKIEEE